MPEGEQQPATAVFTKEEFAAAVRTQVAAALSSWRAEQEADLARVAKGAPAPASEPTPPAEPDPRDFTTQEQLDYVVDALLAGGGLQEYAYQRLRRLRPLSEEAVKAHEYQAKTKPR